VLDKSIAVLSFENRSEDKANAYFADGIQDEILTRLSKIADLKVISRTLQKRTRKSARDREATWRRSHSGRQRAEERRGRPRECAIDQAANDSHLWADTFDRKLTDIFSVESEVAKAIADQLRAHISGREEQVIAAQPLRVEITNASDFAEKDTVLRVERDQSGKLTGAVAHKI
jgi:TolB-like protein